jgi:hypothetical protein
MEFLRSLDPMYVQLLHTLGVIVLCTVRACLSPNYYTQFLHTCDLVVIHGIPANLSRAPGWVSSSWRSVVFEASPWIRFDLTGLSCLMYHHPCLVCANAGYTENEFQGLHVIKRVLVTKWGSLVFIIVRLPFSAPGM